MIFAVCGFITDGLLFCVKFNKLRVTRLNIIKIVNYLYTFSNSRFPHSYPHELSVKSRKFLSNIGVDVEFNVEKSKNLNGYLVDINIF
jgi:hypothetical protein